MAFRSYIALQYVVGENVAIEFKVSEEGQCAPLYDYTLEATLQTKCGGSFDFTFTDDADDADYMVARLDTSSIPAGRHKFELRQTDDDSNTSVLLYGDLILLDSRVGGA